MLKNSLLLIKEKRLLKREEEPRSKETLDQQFSQNREQRDQLVEEINDTEELKSRYYQAWLEEVGISDKALKDPTNPFIHVIQDKFDKYYDRGYVILPVDGTTLTIKQSIDKKKITYRSKGDFEILVAIYWTSTIAPRLKKYLEDSDFDLAEFAYAVENKAPACSAIVEKLIRSNDINETDWRLAQNELFKIRNNEEVSLNLYESERAAMDEEKNNQQRDRFQSEYSQLLENFDKNSEDAMQRLSELDEKIEEGKSLIVENHPKLDTFNSDFNRSIKELKEMVNRGESDQDIQDYFDQNFYSLSIEGMTLDQYKSKLEEEYKSSSGIESVKLQSQLDNIELYESLIGTQVEVLEGILGINLD